MKLVVSVDDHIYQAANVAANAMGKSLEDFVREHLEELAWRETAALEQELAQFRDSARNTPGRLRGWTFERDAINERR